MAENRIQARIKENVMVNPSNACGGGVGEFHKGKEGFVRPDKIVNWYGTAHYVWMEDWGDDMGTDIYYVPAFAVELLT